MKIATTPNSVYAVPLRFTHIAIATSHIPKRYMKYFSNNKFMKKLLFVTITSLLIILLTMFLKNLFGQKSTNTADIKITDQWSVLQGENNGSPMIIRLNTGVKK
ncbi:MAG: hypothetical protein ABH814_02225 [bacterium]